MRAGSKCSERVNDLSMDDVNRFMTVEIATGTDEYFTNSLVVSDNDRSIYVEAIKPDTQAYVMKFNSAGEIQWARGLTPASLWNEQDNSLRLSPSDDFLVTLGSANESYTSVMKIDTSDGSVSNIFSLENIFAHSLAISSDSVGLFIAGHD